MTPPSTVRGLFVRIGGALLGVLLLYVLASGPSFYFDVRREMSKAARSQTMPGFVTPAIYRPLLQAVYQTPLERPLSGYITWWIQLATQHENRGR
jgi:hypothetical protein